MEITIFILLSLALMLTAFLAPLAHPYLVAKSEEHFNSQNGHQGQGD